jgi:hydroxymethylglutaryl-CoA reductase
LKDAIGGNLSNSEKEDLMKTLSHKSRKDGCLHVSDALCFDQVTGAVFCRICAGTWSHKDISTEADNPSSLAIPSLQATSAQSQFEAAFMAQERFYSREAYAELLRFSSC